MQYFRTAACAALTALCLLVASAAPSFAASEDDASTQPPVFEAGFATLASLLPQVGQPLSSEHPVDPATVQQQATGGLLYYDRETNTPAFTNGWDHWALVLGTVVHWQGTDTTPPVTRAVVAPVHMDVPDIIRAAAAAHGIAWRAEQMVNVARCESSFNPHARGDYGTSWGIFQLRSPGLRSSAFYPAGYTDADDPAQAADFVAQWLASGNGWGPWSCARALGYR